MILIFQMKLMLLCMCCYISNINGDLDSTQLRTMYFLLNLEPLVIATHFTAFLIRLAYGHRVNLSKSPILTSATFFFLPIPAGKLEFSNETRREQILSCGWTQLELEAHLRVKGSSTKCLTRGSLFHKVPYKLLSFP